VKLPVLMGLSVLFAQAAAGQSPPAAKLICTRAQLACAALVPLPVSRSLAMRERTQAERELAPLPMNWQVIYVLLPADDPQALDELNALLLSELVARAAAPTASIPVGNSPVSSK